MGHGWTTPLNWLADRCLSLTRESFNYLSAIIELIGKYSAESKHKHCQVFVRVKYEFKNCDMSPLSIVNQTGRYLFLLNTAASTSYKSTAQRIRVKTREYNALSQFLRLVIGFLRSAPSHLSVCKSQKYYSFNATVHTSVF